MMLHFWRCRRAGFTLIEIMIVIAIIAILAGIAIPNIRAARAEAQYQGCLQNCITIGKAIETALIRYSDAELIKMAGGTSANYLGENSTFCTEVLIPLGYMDKVPVCPAGDLWDDDNYTVAFNFYGLHWLGMGKGFEGESWPGWCVCCYIHSVAGNTDGAWPLYAVGYGALDVVQGPK